MGKIKDSFYKKHNFNLSHEFSGENSSKKSIVAVTGPMAAGKNYICEKLKEEGWAAIDADLLVHEAIELAKDRILETFEPYAKEENLQIQREDGSINRKALGQLLFSNPEFLKKQESIVYPIITEKIEAFISSHHKTIINATVLYKTPELLARCEKIIFVAAPFFTRLRRARHRDHLPVTQILRRFHAQRNLLREYQKSGIPVVIINNK
ncbi:MAG: dephospho-CoA kinase [Spirochaetales bacterium]|nr:dephospho-CoA kinase [Spirochaetales bacterium]